MNDTLLPWRAYIGADSFRSSSYERCARWLLTRLEVAQKVALDPEYEESAIFAADQVRVHVDKGLTFSGELSNERTYGLESV